MSKMWNFLGTGLVAIVLSACQSGDTNYAVHRSGYKPSAKALDYSVYPGQSQVIFSIYPKGQGAPAVIRASVESGSLYVESGELKGGKAVVNMENPTLEIPAELSSNKAISDPVGDKMLGKSDYDEAKIEIARVTPQIDEEKGSTHLISVNLKLRNKKRGLQIPARAVVNSDHIALLSVGMFSIDLTKWGMSPEQGGWQNEAVLSLQIRGDAPKK